MTRRHTKISVGQQGNAKFQASKPNSEAAKSSGCCNYFLWFTIFFIASGYGFGLYVMLEEMEETNQFLNLQVYALKNEVEALLNLCQTLPTITKAAGSIKEIKKYINSLKSEFFVISLLKHFLCFTLFYAELQINEIQKENSKQADELLNQVVKSKKFSESTLSTIEDLDKKLTTELRATSSNFNIDISSIKTSVQRLHQIVQIKETQSESLKIDAFFSDLNDLSAEMKRISKQVAQATKIYDSVETTLVESCRNVETQIEMLARHLIVPKEDFSSMRDDVTAINAAPEDVQIESEKEIDSIEQLSDN